MKTAVLLMAYGGPNNLDELEPYLLDVRSGRPVSVELLAEMHQRYARIGGRSPLLDITRQQAAALEAHLNAGADEAGGFKVYVGMRHWRPYIGEALAQIASDGFQKVVAICMAPHASRLSTGAYRKKLEEALARLAQPLEVEFVESWYDRPLFIQALAEKVRRAVAEIPAAAQPGLGYVFSAHSLPASILEQGDPYADQLNETARLLAESLNLDPAQWLFCFQSAGAMDGRWLGPQIHEVLPELAASGVKDVLVTAVGFVAEHVEVLYDLDIEARQQAQSLGIQLYRSASLNTNPAFITAVADLVINHEKVIYSR
jgi:protoporphyrin/coproporphyrin ferrochelatase